MIGNLSAPVSSYVEARAALHQQIKSDQAIGKNAVQEGDQVTLSSNVQVGDKTFLKGSSYSLNPYSDRDNSSEDFTFVQGQSKVHIHHDYAPGFFSTSESLKVDTSGGMNFSNSDQSKSSSGIKPDGWLQKQLESLDGFILQP